MSGKVSYFRNKLQITNPDYVTSLENQDYVIKNIPKYKLTKGLNEKKYRLISNQVTKNLPQVDDWLEESFVNSHKLLDWNNAIEKLHNSEDSKNNQSKSYRRLAFDEICANFYILNQHIKGILSIALLNQ